jgi:hypothetical protein
MLAVTVMPTALDIIFLIMVSWAFFFFFFFPGMCLFKSDWETYKGVPMLIYLFSLHSMSELPPIVWLAHLPFFVLSDALQLLVV